MTRKIRRLLASFGGRRPGRGALAVNHFLGGRSVRWVAYYHGAGLPGARDWPSAIQAVEDAIREHVGQLEDMVTDLEDQVADLEDEIARLRAQARGGAR